MMKTLMGMIRRIKSHLAVSPIYDWRRWALLGAALGTVVLPLARWLEWRWIMMPSALVVFAVLLAITWKSSQFECAATQIAIAVYGLGIALIAASLPRFADEQCTIGLLGCFASGYLVYCFHGLRWIDLATTPWCWAAEYKLWIVGLAPAIIFFLHDSAISEGKVNVLAPFALAVGIFSVGARATSALRESGPTSWRNGLPLALAWISFCCCAFGLFLYVPILLWSRITR